MENIKIINYLCGVGLGSLIFFLIYLYNHFLLVTKYLDQTAYLADKYCEDHENYTINDFKGIILNRKEMLKRFWVTDFDEFIIDREKIKMLSLYYHDLQKKEAIKKTIDCICPWCGNMNKDEYHALDFETGTTILICKNCGASTPACDTKQDCWNLLNPNKE